MGGHLTTDPLTNDSREHWKEDDTHLFLQIYNIINSQILCLVNHCEFVKELIFYLDFVFSQKRKMSHIFDLCKVLYRSEKIRSVSHGLFYGI